MNTEPIKLKKAAAGYLAVVFVIASFLWGYALGTKKGGVERVVPGAVESGTSVTIIEGVTRATDTIDFEQFWDLWEIVKQRYVRQPVDERKMFYGAMAGVVASLGDAHSVFLDPKTNEEFTQELSGKFSGIGAEIGFKKNSLVIVAPLADSPAEKAGLKPGDRIIAIDEEDAGGMTIDEAVHRIRGEKGTVVKLHILRGEELKPRIFEITRDIIKIVSVKFESIKSPKGKRVAVITVTNFNSDTAERFLSTVGTLASQGAYDGLILDLRGNPGGYLDAAITMLGEWVPGEIVVSERYADQSKEDHVASGLGRLGGLKAVVLVDGGSASASEIMAGALKDYDKAVLIGTQTFGKGSVQDLIPLEEAASVKLTIAEWLTPKGTHIDQNGITPDYVIVPAEGEYENDLDSQLDAAKAYFDGVIPKVDSTTSTKATE